MSRFLQLSNHSSRAKLLALLACAATPAIGAIGASTSQDTVVAPAREASVISDRPAVEFFQSDDQSPNGLPTWEGSDGPKLTFSADGPTHLIQCCADSTGSCGIYAGGCPYGTKSTPCPCNPQM